MDKGIGRYMSIFSFRKKCILCGRYHRSADICFAYRGIGVCEECYSATKTSGDKSFSATPPVSYVLAPFDYAGSIKSAIKLYKFAGQRAYGTVFARMMCSELANHSILSGFDHVVPVPLHASRIRERGYNQSEIIAKILAENINVPYCDDVVFRIRETKRQSELKAAERIENVKAAFFAPYGVVEGKRIILVDDIYTMGQTMSACAKALKDAGAGDIVGVTLCKTPFKDYKPFLR